jgi:hypothetical protein
MSQLELFKPVKTQKERVYDFIRDRGRVPTHELNRFGLDNFINSVQSRARELKAEGKIWRVNDRIKLCIAPQSKEDIWSIWEADK